MNDLRPTGCKMATTKNRVYICRVGCTPCRLYHGEICEKLKINAFGNAIKDIMKEETIGTTDDTFLEYFKYPANEVIE